MKTHKYNVGDIVNCTAACVEGEYEFPAKILEVTYDFDGFPTYTIQYLPIEDVYEGELYHTPYK